MTAEQAPVCVLGHHGLDYPRNVALQRALQDLGRPLVQCHSRAPFPFRHLSLAFKLLAAPKTAKVVYVTEGGHRLVAGVRAVARMTGRKVLFDPFLSRYNTRVEDREWYKPGSFGAWGAHFQDWCSTHAADFLLFDTEEHREYFFTRYGLNKPSAILPVGVSEEVFLPQIYTPPSTGVVDVLFYGTYIPLQGIETIVQAVHLLRETPRLRVSLIGTGQTYQKVRAGADRLGLAAPALSFAEPIEFALLPARLAECHISLGIFGSTSKAERVVPNKVVQAAATGRPIVTADTPAIRRYFRHGESAYLVPASNPQALAAALRTLANDGELCSRLASGARKVFETHFSSRAARAIMHDVLQRLEGS